MPENILTLRYMGEGRATFRAQILTWYHTQGRKLPWRGESDPYRVWLAEVMLQQTRVEQMKPYYARFLSLFPAVEDLAGAPREQVLKAWEGLGYYRRAQNLHRAAQEINRIGWPTDYVGWRHLPGVGDYTAAQVAAVLLKLPIGAVDGNIRRVYSRLFAQTHLSPRQLQDIANFYVDPRAPGDFNQALMDLGALVCTPKNPQCLLCPVQSLCQGAGDPTKFPSPKAKTPLLERYFFVVCAQREGQIAIRQRPDQGLLGGLWELPNIQVPDRKTLVPNFFNTSYCTTITHGYTHFRAVFLVYRGDLAPEIAAGCCWVDWSTLTQYPFSRGFQKILQALSP
jgi:A/G-specific adenine glycosylase